MRLCVAFLIISCTLTLTLAAPATDNITLKFLRKCYDHNFIKKHAATVASLVPQIQTQLRNYIQKFRVPLSSIAKRMVPRIEACEGNYDALANEISDFTSVLYSADNSATVKLEASAKKAFAKIDVQSMIKKAVELIDKLN